MFQSIWSARIEGIDFYHILAWFFTYSFLGWVWESTYVSIKSHKFVNRGFVFGPCLTLYGTGAVLVYMCLLPFKGNYVALFFLGMLLATVLEYVTAVLMEKLFHTSWWDYSGKFCNFQGRICLGSSLFWGVLTILLFRYLQPFVAALVGYVPRNVGIPVLMVVVVVYIGDFTISCIGAAHISEKLAKVNEVVDEFANYLKNSPAASAAKDVRQRAENYRAALSTKGTVKHLEKIKDSLASRLNANPELTEAKDAIMNKYEEFRNRFVRTHHELTGYDRRIMRDYPHLGRGYNNRQAKKAEKLAKKTQKKDAN